ncbi:hypothetical protein OROMI_004349 [Orobanche minor]
MRLKTIFIILVMVSAGIPDVRWLVMDNILRLLVFPLVLPSLRSAAVNERGLSAATSLYLLCCILRIVKIKDVANTVAAALLCRAETFAQNGESKPNGDARRLDSADADRKNTVKDDNIMECGAGSMQVKIPSSGSFQGESLNGFSEHDCKSTQYALRLSHCLITFNFIFQ